MSRIVHVSSLSARYEIVTYPVWADSTHYSGMSAESALLTKLVKYTETGIYVIRRWKRYRTLGRYQTLALMQVLGLASVCKVWAYKIC